MGRKSVLEVQLAYLTMALLPGFLAMLTRYSHGVLMLPIPAVLVVHGLHEIVISRSNRCATGQMLGAHLVFYAGLGCLGVLVVATYRLLRERRRTIEAELGLTRSLP